MPQITTNKSGGRIVFNSKDWLSGINFIDESSDENFIGATLNSNTKIFNPFNNLGAACAGPELVDVTNVSIVGDEFRMGVIGQDTGGTNYAYGITTNAELHRIDTTTGALSSGGSWKHSISGSAPEIGEEVVTYKIGSTDYLFYSWYDTSNGDVGRYDFDTTFDDDFMSTVPSGAASFNRSNPMPMKVGLDDILYIADGNELHAFDGQTGANGTLSKSVLTLPTDYVITSLATYEPRTLLIFAYKKNNSATLKTDCKVFFWDYLDLDPYRVIDLDDNFARGAFNWKGTIGCFTTGRRNPITKEQESNIQLFDGDIFQTVQTFEGDVPLNGGVEVFTNHIMFQSGGVVYGYGNFFKGMDNGLHKITQGNNVTGMLLAISSELIVASFGTGIAGGLQILDQDTFSSSMVMETIAAHPDFPPRVKGKITQVTVVFAAPATAGRSVLIKINTDTNDLDNLDTISTVTSDQLIQTYYQAVGGLFPLFRNIGIRLEAGAGTNNTDFPKIKEVSIDFEYNNLDKQ